MTNTICPRCNGTQWLLAPDADLDSESESPRVPCVCLQRSRIRAFLGDTIGPGPLVRSHLCTPERDGTKENLFLRGSWEEVCKHIRWALSVKWRFDPGFTFRATSDAQLLDVWVGNQAYQNKNKVDRETTATYNSLADFLEGPSLVIVRLGTLRRNRAGGDVLFNAFGVREHLSKPTWVVESDVEFNAEHPTYTSQTYSLLHKNFTFENLGGTHAEIEEVKEVYFGDRVETPKSTEIDRPRYTAPSSSSEPDVDELFSGMGPLSSGKKPFKKKWNS